MSAEANEDVRSKMNVIDMQSAWESKLLHTSRGVIQNCLANVAIYLENHETYKGNIRLNELASTIEVRGCGVVNGSWTPIEDEHVSRITVWMQTVTGMLGTKSNGVMEMIRMVAFKNRENPVKKYLEDLEWDGSPRLDNYCLAYLKADVSSCPEYFQAIGAKWLISGVARIMEPGCKVDHVLVFETKQGQNKSKSCEALVPEISWFTDQVSPIGTKDASQDLCGKWIIELSELDAVNAREDKKNKAFISRKIDHYRPSYARVSKDVKRQCIFVGTVNPDGGYLTDPTGNRRYWPVKVGSVDDKAIARDRDQLWAEAVHRYKQGEEWWLSRELEDRASEQQKRRSTLLDHPWYELVIEAAYKACLGGAPLSTVEVYKQIDPEINIGRIEEKHTRKIASILRFSGAELKRDPSGDRRNRWVFTLADKDQETVNKACKAKAKADAKLAAEMAKQKEEGLKDLERDQL